MSAQRLRFILDGDDQLSRVLNHAGDSSARLHRRLNDDMDGNSRAVNRFFQSADGRLRDLRGRFISVADAQRLMGDGLPNLTRHLGDVASASSSASGSGLEFMTVLKGAAVVLGTTLLPAIGALVPMAVGAGAALGTLKLGFAGVSDAMAAAGQGKKEYAKALKHLSPPARDFTRALVSLKKEFGPIGREIQKAMLPGFTAAVKAAGPVVKILGRAMTDMGGAFGHAAEGVARMLKDSGFQDALQKNLQLGAGFVRDMTSAMGPFIRSLLDFGAASGPTLKAFSDGLGGLLTRGLPGFFQGLTPGIGGAAKMLDGLFDSINTILPALGRLAGEMGKVLGPLFGETFRLLGDVVAGALDGLAGGLELLAPFFRDLTFGLKTIRDLGAIIGPTMADTGRAIIGAFAPAADKIRETAGPLQRLNGWINDNKIGIMEYSRQFADMSLLLVSTAIQAAPQVIKAFSFMSSAIILAISTIAHGAAMAFGWIPGIGPKLRKASGEFDKFSGAWLKGLDVAQHKADEFAASTQTKLAAGQLKMNIDNWSSQLAEAKRKLATLPPSKRADLKATIKDLEDKVARARRDLQTLDGKTAMTYVVTTYKIVGSGAARAAQSTGGGRIFERARGGIVRLAGGGAPGLVRGPGTGTSDSIPAMLSDGEYVVRASSVAKYGLSFLNAVNAGTYSARTGAAGIAAGQGLASGLSGSLGLVLAAARSMAGGVVTGIKTELEIASPSKKTKALAHDVARGFLEGLTRSRDKIKSTAADLVKDIKTAFSGRKESSLIRMVDRQTKRLMDLAAKRDKIAATIAAAKQYASDVTRNAREGASLSNLGMDADQVTAGGIKAGLAGKLAQIKHFTRYIDILAKKGLNKGLLRQILNMGPEAGYAYASALVGADKNTFKSINSLQSQLDKSTTTLGQVGADRLYDAGRNAGRGFLKGLEGQQKDIERLMMSIAKSMQKSIKRALGIKSPSTVMARLGSYSTQGLARGLVDGMPALDRALDAVSGRVAATQPVMGRPAVAGAGGGGTFVQIDVHGAMDPVATAREIRRTLLELKRVHGLNVTLGVA
ncbi:hypothetical protein [Streptomyces sp. NPDC047079]|uniref:hypothetical protein n=1 Tax=Streptomyces sp. NPDC047079 TaxID=3154607 RepID=UPI0033DA4A4C